MFALTESTPLYLCRQAVDMRKGIDGLYRLVRTELQQHPLSGSAFVFFSKNRQSVKILRWDGDGFLLYHKRLERGTVRDTPFRCGLRSLQTALEDVFSDHGGNFATERQIPQEVQYCHLNIFSTV